MKIVKGLWQQGIKCAIWFVGKGHSPAFQSLILWTKGCWYRQSILPQIPLLLVPQLVKGCLWGLKKFTPVHLMSEWVFERAKGGIWLKQAQNLWPVLYPITSLTKIPSPSPHKVPIHLRMSISMRDEKQLHVSYTHSLNRWMGIYKPDIPVHLTGYMIICGAKKGCTYDIPVHLTRWMVIWGLSKVICLTYLLKRMGESVYGG